MRLDVPLVLDDEDEEDDELYCPACGEPGHSYRECWAIDSDEGDRS